MFLQIMDTKCKEEEPYYIVDGDFDDDYSSDILYIGYVSQVHYQSLLIVDSVESDEDGQNGIDLTMEEEGHEDRMETDKVNGSYASLDLPSLEEQEIEENFEDAIDSTTGREVKDQKYEIDDRCPSCRKTFKSLLMHIQRNKKCKASADGYLRKLEERSKLIKKEQKRVRIRRYRTKVKNEDPEKLRNDAKEWKVESRKRLRNEAHGYVLEKKKGKEWKTKSRNESKKADPQAHKEKQKQYNANFRRDDSAIDRFRKFQEAVMYGPMFICGSCHGKMFRCSVKILTNRLVEQIDEKIPIEDCIDFNAVTKVITESRHVNLPPLFKKNELEVGERFVCDTCLRYLKKGKLPPKSFKNSLELQFSDAELKKEDLWLTELEGSLIAQNIVFQKIFQLPKSRWTGLKDKVINVPISAEAINNTLALLPRTPAKAGLIGISLKRKKEMKNTHQKQLINPDKVFRMLQKLKDSGSPYHQNLMTPANYRAMCNETDKTGYETIYGEEEEDILEDLEEMPRFDLEDELTDEDTGEDETSQDDESKDGEKSDEEELKAMDPVKKYHFTYDESLCMMDRFPEISVAPGEGQRPKGILGDKHWDVKAFPHLHNPDGSNGKDQERKVRLKDQEYFIQRIINKEKRFAETPAYLYSSVAFLEEKRIYQSLSLVGSRGKEVKGEGGTVSYQLDDEFRVLETIPNSPKYWQRMKYEILAKIENLGPFNLFFTLSCADMRWDATFATILSEKGYSIMFIKTEEDGLPKTLVEVQTATGDWKSLRKFLEDDIADSKHELIRGNVVMATRYFHHRVKSFISKVVMSKSNPMHVKNYTYKVEFQGRGTIDIISICKLLVTIFIYYRSSTHTWDTLVRFGKN